MPRRSSANWASNQSCAGRGNALGFPGGATTTGSWAGAFSPMPGALVAAAAAPILTVPTGGRSVSEGLLAGRSAGGGSEPGTGDADGRVGGLASGCRLIAGGAARTLRAPRASPGDGDSGLVGEGAISVSLVLPVCHQTQQTKASNAAARTPKKAGGNPCLDFGNLYLGR